MAYKSKERYFKYLEQNYGEDTYREPKSPSEKEWFNEWFETTDHPGGKKANEMYSKMMEDTANSWNVARIFLHAYLKEKVGKVLNAHYDGKQLTIWGDNPKSNVKLRVWEKSAIDTYKSEIPVASSPKAEKGVWTIFFIIITFLAGLSLIFSTSNIPLWIFKVLGIIWVLEAIEDSFVIIKQKRNERLSKANNGVGQDNS